MRRAGRAQACGGHRLQAFVGSYAPKGKGIYRFGVQPSGELVDEGLAAATPSPSWLTYDPSRRVLYACNEIADFNGTPSGSVSAYAVDAEGALRLLNTMGSGGAAPVHLGLHPGGRFAFVANHGGGTVAVLPLAADGSLMPASDVWSDAHAPGGHPHMVLSDPAGRFVIANDLGRDRTIVWAFDAAHGRLVDPRTVPSSAGAGPRHFAFHPNGRWLYSLNEEASTLAFMHYEPATGALALQDEVSTLPAGFAGTSFASGVIVAPDGRHLYALNRLHDSIAVFALGPGAGRPRLVGEEWTRGSYPRSCSLDPSGRHLYVCNQRSDHVAVFRVTPGGRLQFTGQYAGVGSAAAIAFVAS
jgi:6-phosphogluconolactonase (cycloisomerase 2 family)